MRPPASGPAPAPPVLPPVLPPVSLSVSVIVPVYRDWDRVPGLLAALAAQDVAGAEVILVNNDTRPAPDLASIGSSAGPAMALRIVDCARPGSYAARNAGAAQARGGWLVFTDADCLPVPGWLAALTAAARDAPPGQILLGPVVLQPGPNPGAWEVFDTVRGMPQEMFLRHGYGVTANLALAAAQFHRLGGFDAGRYSGGDAEFCRRATRQGASLRLVDGAVVTHPARTSRAEVVTKARRIKGGQITGGSRLSRRLWLLRSFAPPLREMLAYLRASRHPMRWRLIACRVRWQLWGVELAEIWRLLILRAAPERR